MILLDTHAIVWTATDGEKLGAETRSIISAAQNEDGVAVSAITFWEIALLNSKRRIITIVPAELLRRQFLDQGGIELSITGEIGILAATLESLHGDPADHFIVATAIAYNATLITADRRILDWDHSVKRHDALV